MIAKCWYIVVVAGMLDAAVIRGVVVEHMTGKPLIRANVSIVPVPGTPGSAVARRTDRFGGFTVSGLPAGAYMVNVARYGFATSQFGQKEWKSAGQPVVLEESASAFLNVRLRRLGSIAGTVFDEEDLGLPDHEVVAYRDTEPPELVTRAKTDDRGNFRLFGLMPGKYLVRTVGKHYDDGDYLPTFSRATGEARQATRYEVGLDEQTSQAVVRPQPGRLISVAGAVTVGDVGNPMIVTLVNDMGRYEQKGYSPSVSFHFANMPPGDYELYGKVLDSATGAALFGRYRAITAPPNRGVNLSMQWAPVRGTGASVVDRKGAAIDPALVQVLTRSRDLAGVGELQRFAAGSAARLPPGRWEFALSPSPLYSVVEFSGNRGGRDTEGPDGWHEVVVTPFPAGVKWVVSKAPAGVRGTVKSPGQDPVVGVPVFLEAAGLDARKRVIEIRTTLTDLRGQYHFEGLSPGSYRLLATFEYEQPDSAAMDAARAQSVRVEDGQLVQLDLTQYEIR